MKAIQVWRLEHRVRESFREAGMRAARHRQSDDAPVVKAFMEARGFCVPSDPVLTLLRFEAFADGWKSAVEYDAEQKKQDDSSGSTSS